MSALDSGFLQLEDEHAALHIGSVGVFEGPVPAFAEVREEIIDKLPRVRRYRQRMARVPGNLGRPVWRDDPEFDLDNHLHRAALPRPGGEAELAELVGAIMAVPLDHERPLWEDWMVEGLAGGRWALVTKVHHSMVDGIAGTDLLTTLFGRVGEGESGEAVPAPAHAEGPGAGPDGAFRSHARLVAQAVRTNTADAVTAARSAATALRHPRSLTATAGASTSGLLHFLSAARPVTRSSLIGPLGSARRYRWAQVPLDQVLQIRADNGCTVNDVVLAAVTLAFRRLLLGRGEIPSPHTVRTLVPVSVRRADQRGALDNRVSAILVDLPVDESDPAAVLATISGRMVRLKASHEAEAGELVTSLGNLVPPPGLAAGLRLAFRVPQRVLTTVTTNVPGPREDLWLAGRRMLAAYPYVPIADRVRVGTAVTSYAGDLLFGFTADGDSTPDIDLLRDGLLDAFTELSSLAAERSRR